MDLYLVIPLHRVCWRYIYLTPFLYRPTILLPHDQLRQQSARPYPNGSGSTEQAGLHSKGGSCSFCGQGSLNFPHYPYHPWGWYIYLHEKTHKKSTIHVGRYTNPMDGYEIRPPNFGLIILGWIPALVVFCSLGFFLEGKGGRKGRGSTGC